MVFGDRKPGLSRQIKMMSETFKLIGLEDAKSVTVALAPLAMITGIFIGIAMFFGQLLLSCFLLSYKLLIPKYSFERGIADYGQSMGTTSIGLMFQSIVDKDNKSNGKEAFAIKQLIFEPFVGGGIITGLSAIIIHKIGLLYFTGIALFLTLTFFLGGYFYKRYRARDLK
jgi:ESS family glutamate:Na+ symporter